MDTYLKQGQRNLSMEKLRRLEELERNNGLEGNIDECSPTVHSKERVSAVNINAVRESISIRYDESERITRLESSVIEMKKQLDDIRNVLVSLLAETRKQ